MPLQDLTPQLRTRLSKVERMVGWFVILAALLLVSGFLYYTWHTAKRKGWFVTKVQYQTGVNNAAGLHVGDPVMLMGSDAGEITAIIPNDPEAWYGQTVYFNIRAPKYGYIWSDSTARISENLFGGRYVEVTKGVAGVPTVREGANKEVAGMLKFKVVEERMKELATEEDTPDEQFARLKEDVKANPEKYYAGPDEEARYWVVPDESPSINARLDRMAKQIEEALPAIFSLTNRASTVLYYGTAAASNANSLLLEARPVVANLNRITDQISDPNGSLGNWLLPPDLRREITNTLGTTTLTMSSANQTLAFANTTITNADWQLTRLASELDVAVRNLSSITSNLNQQVAANTNLLKSISDAVVHADEFVQGLKHHWLLRSAFKEENQQEHNWVTPKPAKSGKLK